MLRALAYACTFLVLYASAGCYEKQLCCVGRNLTCTARDGDSNYSRWGGTVSEFTGSTQKLVYDDRQQVIGRLLANDMIALEGSGVDDSDYSEFDETQAIVWKKPILTPKLAFERIIFGDAYDDTNPNMQIIGHHLHSNIVSSVQFDNDEYSILSRYMPLTIITATSEPQKYDDSKLMYLKTSQGGPCYCDEICLRLGDCCSDYILVCPPVDCMVSEWSTWSECVSDNKSEKCGEGTRTRIREKVREDRYGGRKCPSLAENVHCFKECARNKGSDTEAVALLLEYEYKDVRSKLSRDNIYWDLPEVIKKVRKLSRYCVSYEIGWVHQHCDEKKYNAKLFDGNVICAECQPEAQMHRESSRCASDLNDGERGYWKLYGTKYCYGTWKRIARTEGCLCAEKFPDNDSFLLA